MKHRLSFITCFVALISLAVDSSGQCPNVSHISNDGACLFVYWDVPPPSGKLTSAEITDTLGIGYAYFDGDGTATSPAIYKIGEGSDACNHDVSLFSGSLNINGEQCIFDVGLLVEPMPNSLVSFRAERENGAVRVIWETSQEVDNLGYDVEHSKDALSWATIHWAEGKSNSGERTAYEFRDANAQSGTNYYRLKQYDINGRFTYSNILSVSNGSANRATSPIFAFPNPASSEVFLNIADNVDGAVIHLSDSYGKKILHQDASDNIIDVRNLPPGVYVLSIKGQRINWTDLIVVQ